MPNGQDTSGEPTPANDDTDELPVIEPPAAAPPHPPPAAPPPAPSAASPRRWIGLALVLAGVVVVLVVIGLLVTNVVLARSAEQQAAAHAEEALGTPVTVTLSGWPVGLRLLAGRPIDVELRARDVPLPDSEVILDSLELELEGVPVDLDELDQPEPELRAERGRFVAELGEDAVQAQIGVLGQLPLVDVELRSGVARLSVARFPVIDATAEVSDGQVVFSPTAPIGGFANVELRAGELPFGFAADDVEIRPGVLRLSGSATDVRLGATLR